MADNILKGIVSIEVQGVQELSALQKQVSSFGNGVKASVPPAADAFKKLASPINDAVVSFKKIPPVVGQAGNSFTSIPSATNQASTALRRVPQAANQASFAVANLGRVVQDAPFGFLGIANNLNPLLESFERLKATTGTTGGALKALGSSLLGPAGIGFAVSIISSLLIVFGDSLFSTSVSFSKAELAAAKFANEIKNAKDGIQQFNDYLNFQLDLSRLTNELTLGKGFAADQQGLRDEFNKNNQVIANSQGIISKYNKEIDNIRQNSKFFLGSAGQKLLSEFPTAAELPDNLIEKLNKSDKSLLTSVKENAKLVQDEYKRASEADKRNKQIELQLKINSNEESKKAYQKNLDDYQRYQNSVISAAKDLAEKLRKEGRLDVPFFFDFEGVDKQFKKAVELFNRASGNSRSFLKPVEVPLKFTLPENFRSVLLGESGGETQTFAQKVSSTINRQIESLVSSSPSTISPRQQKQVEDAKNALLELKSVGMFVGESLAGIFNSVFDAIGSGKSAIQSVGEAVKNLVVQLAKAAIQAAITSIILNILAPGSSKLAGGFGGIFKNLLGISGGRATGGPVQAGKGYVVGENGPEYFQPGTSGSIIPNGRLSTMSGGGFAGRVVFEISGNKLIGVLANGNRSQGALI